MKKFIYFLADTPDYPNEIFAQSREEVKNLILESVPDESHILKIVEASVAKNPVANAEFAEPDDFNNSQDFFNNVIKAGANKAQQIQKAEQQIEQPIEQPIQQPQEIAESSSQNNAMQVTCIKSSAEPVYSEPTPVQKIVDPPKFFEEAGIQFKLEDGKLYKKSWINVTDSDMPEFRIINKSNNKLVANDKYKIEKLEWVEI